MRKLLLATAAFLASGSTAFASNYINLDATAANTGVAGLTINQDATHATSSITGNGSQGTTLNLRGTWTGVTINQYGGNDSLSGSIKSATGSTSASLNLTYGATAGGGTKGFNSHSLTIGATNAPTNPNVLVTMVNNNATPSGANKNDVTDVIDVNGGHLGYVLNIAGDSNIVSNTVSGAGNTNLSETLASSNGNTVTNALTSGGGVLGYTLNVSGGDANTLNNTVNSTGAISMNQTLVGGSNNVTNVVGGTTQVASYSETTGITGSNNVVDNTVDGAGAKTVNVALASSGNSVANGMSGTGAQTSSLTADSGSLIDYTLTAGTNASPLAGGSSASVILSNVIGAASSQGLVNVTQSGAGASLNFTANGGAFTLGGGGINITQASPNATLIATVTAAANGYTYTITQ